MADVILYDLPSKGRCACWSLNPWKPRLILNLKGIPYKTEWIEYPDLAPTLKAFGIPPNPEGSQYTSPTVRIGDKYVMDSKNIAVELERHYPSPSLHLDLPVLPKVQEIINTSFQSSLRGVLMPKIPSKLLTPGSAPFWIAKREKEFGMPLPQLEKETNVDNAWEKATPGMEALGALLKADGGPFILGKVVSYADLIIVAALHCIRRVGEENYERAVAIEPALGTLYEVSKAWLERDDH
ncbi:hypothetical protein ACLMJK_001944 [Lecanora helva]